MITFRYSFSSKTVFVDYSENKTEEGQLETLARQTKFIGDTFKVTGLYLVDDFHFGVGKVVITSLRKRETLSPTELELVKKAVQVNVERREM